MKKSINSLNTQQNLSSDTLFHFTDSLDILKLILENGFQARFIYEKLPKMKLAYFVKTICFCDIPLGAIKTHLNWYGGYGLGISRPKAKDYGISPVFYVHSKSPQINFSSSLKNQYYLNQDNYTKYLKQVRGKQIFYDDKKQKHYWKWKKFYEEREWRYFPDEDEIKIKRYKNEIELEEHRSDLNNSFSLPYLKINETDLEYIIVESKKDFDQLIKTLKLIYHDNKTWEKLLIKILTTDQIMRDF